MNTSVGEKLPQLRLSNPEGVLNFNTLRNLELSGPATPKIETGGQPETGRFGIRAAIGQQMDSNEEVSSATEVANQAAGSDIYRKLVYLLSIIGSLLLLTVGYLIVDGGYLANEEEGAVTGNIGFAVGLGGQVPDFVGYWLDSKDVNSAWFSQDDMLGRATCIIVWSGEDAGIVELLSKANRLAPSVKNQSRPVRMITLNLDDDPAIARAVLKKAGAGELETIWDRHGETPADKRVSALWRTVESPKVYLVDERGRLEAAGIKLKDLVEVEL